MIAAMEFAISEVTLIPVAIMGALWLAAGWIDDREYQQRRREMRQRQKELKKKGLL